MDRGGGTSGTFGKRALHDIYIFFPGHNFLAVYPRLRRAREPCVHTRMAQQRMRLQEQASKLMAGRPLSLSRVAPRCCGSTTLEATVKRSNSNWTTRSSSSRSSSSKTERPVGGSTAAGALLAEQRAAATARAKEAGAAPRQKEDWKPSQAYRTSATTKQRMEVRDLEVRQ